MDRLLPAITAMLMELLAPAGILARNDPRVRILEGLPQRIDVVHGDVPDAVVVREGPVEYDVDLRKGQKTGLFLDQRENREAAARYARGRLLDCFSYHRGFALRLAGHCVTAGGGGNSRGALLACSTYHGGFARRLAGHCVTAEAVDISADAVARIESNAARNRVDN